MNSLSADELYNGAWQLLDHIHISYHVNWNWIFHLALAPTCGTSEFFRGLKQLFTDIKITTAKVIGQKVTSQNHYFGEGVVVRGERWCHSKERWWFPKSCPLWPISNHSVTICRRMSQTLKSTGLVTLMQKFGEEGADRCKQNFDTIREKNNTYSAVNHMHERDA